jgi:hypothetical protein
MSYFRKCFLAKRKTEEVFATALGVIVYLLTAGLTTSAVESDMVDSRWQNGRWAIKSVYRQAFDHMRHFGLSEGYWCH